jgi:Icc-related predicted phosphoesterase
MRVLALADRPFHINLQTVVERHGIDAIVCLGDLQPSWVEPVDALQLPKFGVYGNHDDEPYMDWHGIDDVHMRRLELDCGLSIAGFEGCVTYRRGRGRLGPSHTQKEAAKLLRKLPPADIVLAHCPPAGVNDDPDDIAHVGFDALREWVLEHRPRVLLHGHTYPQPGRRVDRLGDTRIEYVHGARIIDLPAAPVRAPSPVPVRRRAPLARLVAPLAGVASAAGRDRTCAHRIKSPVLYR